MILEVFSNLNDSTILFLLLPQNSPLSIPADCNGRRWEFPAVWQMFGGVGEKTCVPFYSSPTLWVSSNLTGSMVLQHLRKIPVSASLSCGSSHGGQGSCHVQSGREGDKLGTSLAGQTWASTRTSRSNGQPFKVQKTTGFYFLCIKNMGRDGMESPVPAQGSCAASVTRDAVVWAGGHCRRARLHQMEFKALLSNVIHSLFPGAQKKKQESSSKENTLTI